MQAKEFHLQMIQSVINRMATNSFHLKGWSVTLTAALFALAAKDAVIGFVYLAYFPIVAFWLLDAFFLYQEKLFRALYDHVRQLDSEGIDYSMNTSIVKSMVSAWSDVALSKTILGFHLVVVISTVCAMMTVKLSSPS